MGAVKKSTLIRKALPAISFRNTVGVFEIILAEHLFNSGNQFPDLTLAVDKLIWSLISALRWVLRV